MQVHQLPVSLKKTDSQKARIHGSANVIDEVLEKVVQFEFIADDSVDRIRIPGVPPITALLPWISTTVNSQGFH